MTSAEKIEIYYSPWRMLSQITGVAGFIVLGYFMASGAMGGASALNQVMGFAAMILAAAAVIFILRQWFIDAAPVVTLTPSGLTDIRIAKEEIPWTAISNLALWQQGRHKSLVLTIDPEIEARLTLTRLARWTREPNKALGVDGLCVAGSGLKIKFEMLAELIAERFRGSRPGCTSIA